MEEFIDRQDGEKKKIPANVDVIMKIKNLDSKTEVIIMPLT